MAQLGGDEAFRQRVEENPAALVAWGIPNEALEPVLIAIGAPDDVCERAEAASRRTGERPSPPTRWSPYSERSPSPAGFGRV